MPDAAAWGLAPGFHDIAGHWHGLQPETERAILAAMGAESERPPPAPVRSVAAGRRLRLPRDAELVTEDGASLRGLTPPLEPGYHRLRSAGGETLLIAAPGRCQPPPRGRRWGWAAQLYSLRSAQSWGVGDLHDLAELARWSRSLGAAALFVNPLHAPVPRRRQEASPYYPSSRCFRNPLYIALEEPPGGTLERLNRLPEIDRDRVWRRKLAVLEERYASFVGDAAFDAYLAEQGQALEDFATFCALAERRRRPWREWPAGLRNPRTREVAQYRRANARRVRFHAWLQWQLDVQLARAAAAGAGIVHDLAVGIAPDGADAWRWQDILAGELRIGSPPDPFQAAGQDWGMPPFDPWRLRAAGYAPLIETLRAAFRHGAGLRIDHVMAFFRLFWIPAGGSPAEGAYVHYPDQELLAVLALESRRARAFVVGEDLGTVENRVRAELLRRGVLGYRLLYFEQRLPAQYPAQAVAAASTHDLPTLAGVLAGADHGLLEHLERYAGVHAGMPVEEVVLRTYSTLAAAPSRVVVASLEDALRVVEQPNRPGTLDPRNWSLALPGGLERLRSDPFVSELASVLRAGRRRS